mgnify:CR=1 FL=1
MAEIQPQARKQPVAAQRWPQQRHLKRAGGQHAPGQRHDRAIQARGQPQHRGNQREVVQHRRQRRQRETLEAVEHAAGERRHRDEEDVRKDDAQHLGGEFQLARLGGKARCHQRRNPGGGEHSQPGHHQQHRAQRAGHVIDEGLQRCRIALLAQFGQDGRVGGEIAAHGVLFEGAVDVVAHQAAVLHLPIARTVIVTGAKRRHFDDLGAEDDVRQAEAPPDQAAVAEELLDLFGRGAGGDVEILGLASEQQVAHRAAHQIRLEARLVEPIQHPQRARTDVLAGNGMKFTRDDAQDGGIRGHELVAGKGAFRIA